MVKQAPRSEWIEGRQAMQTPEDVQAMIDLKHPLAVLARRLLWAQIEVALAPKFCR
jgi:hypothetical protein